MTSLHARRVRRARLPRHARRDSWLMGWDEYAVIVGILLAAVLLIFVAGCAGDKARIAVLAPAISNSWPSIKASAEKGVACSGHSKAVQDSELEEVRRFDEALRTFNRMGAGGAGP